MSEQTHQKCPFCGSSDAFSYNTESGVFKCFSCGATPTSEKGLCFDGETLVNKYEGSHEVTEDYEQPEMYIPDNYRGISKATMESHGVYFTKGSDGKETVHYPYPNGVKHRELPKSIKISGKMDAFFGQDEYNGSGKCITITEGEEDRLSVIQMMGDWPCVSVPGATPSKEFWAKARDFLSGFEKIVLSVDNDEAGDKLAERIYKMFPGKTYRVPHTKYKDANDFLVNGASREYKSAWWNAQKMKPENLLHTQNDFLKLYKETPNYEYFPTGVEGLDEKMLGIHKGAFTIVVAPTGIGKTEFFRYLEYTALNDTNYTIASCHLEETPLRSALGVVSYLVGDNVTRKDLIEEKGLEDHVEEWFRILTASEQYYQFQIRSDEGPEELVEQIRFMVNAFGVDYVFFEPIQDIVSGNVADKESKLSDLSNTLKRLAPELNVGIVAIAHANEDGDTKYCKTIAQSAAFEIVLAREVDAEDEEERNTMKVFVGRKNRVGGGSGPAGELTFDRDTYMLSPKLGPMEPIMDHSDKTVVGF